MQPKRQRHSPCNVNDAALGQPPAKSRRVRKSQTHREVHAEESHPSNDPFEANEGVTEGSVSSDVSSMQVDSPIVDDGTAATGATQTGAPPPSAKRNFLELLEENMSRRREARLSGASSPSELLAALPQPKRRRTSTGAIPGSGSKICRPLGPDEDPRKVLWEPPVSPYGLLEEELYDDPWKLLTACMLLNKTTGTQVRKIIWDLFQLCPTPQAAVAADTSRIQDLIQPLGLFRKRAVAIQRLSEDYLNKAWRDPQELYGIGKYAADAYYIFCRGAWKDVQPEDKDLRRYVEWLEQTGGLGSGLMRHRTEQEPVGVSV